MDGRGHYPGLVEHRRGNGRVVPLHLRSLGLQRIESVTQRGYVVRSTLPFFAGLEEAHPDPGNLEPEPVKLGLQRLTLPPND